MLGWTAYDTWIVVIGVLCAMSCALLGNYLVLRRLSMMGDAISHTVLPGLAIAFLLTGSRDSLTMFIGACVVGVLTALLVQWLLQTGKLDEGASMGVVFTSLFALGLLLIRKAADHVDLDPHCVLYGAIELAPLNTTALLGWEVPQAAVTNGAILLLNAVFVLLFYKELKITSFDPALATTLGINANVMHYLLMTLVAATTVAAFESVGSILVIAMLIVPGACAHLLTDRMSAMLGLSLLIAAMSAVLGHVGAITIPTWFGFSDTSTAGMMAVMAGVLFVATFLFSPRYGLVSRMVRQLRQALRITRDDVLGYLYRQEELVAGWHRGAKIRDALRPQWRTRLALLDLVWRRKLLSRPDGYRLTDNGKDDARRLVRSHRLWETYLVNVLGQDPNEVHHEANRVEHVIDERLQELLESETGRPSRDPHEREIPE